MARSSRKDKAAIFECVRADLLLGNWSQFPKDTNLDTDTTKMYQLPRAKGVLFGFENLCQRQDSLNRISTVRQLDRLHLHQQQRGYTLSPTYDSGLRHVGLVSDKRIEGHEGVEVGPNNYSAFSAELSDGFVCEPSNQPIKLIYGAIPPPSPFNVISKTLTKVTIDQTELILVAPVWQAQPVWPVLLRLLIF